MKIPEFLNGLRKLILPMVVLAAGYPIVGCTEDEPGFVFGKATVTIEQSEQSTGSGFTVTFTPSENAVSFYYSLGSVEDAVLFENLEMDTVMVNGNAPETIFFDNLESKKQYAIFAKAYDESGIAGSTAMYLASTADGSFNLAAEYVGNDNAGFIINYSPNNYSSIEYYLGEQDDYDAFVNGELETESFEPVLQGRTVLNYLSDLQPSHDYVMFIKGYGLIGDVTVRTLEFTTLADGENADLELDYEIDLYKGVYTLEANDNCSQMDVLFSNRGQFITGAEDIVETMDLWQSIGFNVVRTKDKVFEIEKVTKNLRSGQKFEMWVVCYNNDYEAETIRHFEFATPEYDENAPDATVEVVVSDITETGATYTYSPDENADFFLYETIDGEWYDYQIEKNPDFDLWSYFEMNVDMNAILVYSKDLENRTFRFTETTGTSGKKYYAAALPMNKNGHSGRQTPVLIPFTTK